MSALHQCVRRRVISVFSTPSAPVPPISPADRVFEKEVLHAFIYDAMPWLHTGLLCVRAEMARMSFRAFSHRLRSSTRLYQYQDIMQKRR